MVNTRASNQDLVHLDPEVERNLRRSRARKRLFQELPFAILDFIMDQTSSSESQPEMNLERTLRELTAPDLSQ